jgi:hypothetical protein
MEKGKDEVTEDKAMFFDLLEDQKQTECACANLVLRRLL